MADPRPKQLLVVGPLPPGCDDLAALLRPLGEPRLEPDPGRALLALARGELTADLLLLTGDGPLVSRLEFLAGAAGLQGAGRAPALLLAAPGEEELLVRALEAGASDALLLPYRPADLQARATARLRAPRAEVRPRRFDAAAFHASAHQPAHLQAGFTFGSRLFLSPLGGVGISRVLKTLRLDDGTLAAVKLLDPEVAAQDPDWSKRFEREHRHLSGLEHENLVRVRAGGTLDGVPFLDMDYCAGETLDAVIDREGVFPAPRALDVATQVARGLSALHARNIIHRDVKPENVLVAAEGRVRLCDFGLSKPQDDAGLTHEGEILGTAAFIAPETLLGTPPGFAADIYALGITLFEMLTGEDAIDPGPAPQMFQASTRGTAQAKALLRLKGPLRELTSRMLAVDPSDRFPDVPALLRELERVRAAG